MSSPISTNWLVLRQTFFQTAANGVNHPLPGKRSRFPDIHANRRARLEAVSWLNGAASASATASSINCSTSRAISWKRGSDAYCSESIAMGSRSQ